MMDKKAHLGARLQRLNDSYIDTWPRWNNADLVSVSELLHENVHLTDENARYKAALEFYASTDNYWVGGTTNYSRVSLDLGWRAREALGIN